MPRHVTNLWQSRVDEVVAAASATVTQRPYELLICQDGALGANHESSSRYSLSFWPFAVIWNGFLA